MPQQLGALKIGPVSESFARRAKNIFRPPNSELESQFPRLPDQQRCRWIGDRAPIETETEWHPVHNPTAPEFPSRRCSGAVRPELLAEFDQSWRRKRQSQTSHQSEFEAIVPRQNWI